jgi:hypothetical protein
MGMIEQKIVMRMNLLKLSRLVLSQLTGIREQVLSPGLKSMKPFANTELEFDPSNAYRSRIPSSSH